MGDIFGGNAAAQTVSSGTADSAGINLNDAILGANIMGDTQGANLLGGSDTGSTGFDLSSIANLFSPGIAVTQTTDPT